MKYRFKPTNDITMYEIIEIVRAVNFEVPSLVYDQMTRGHRHFEVIPEDTLAKPKESPLEAKPSYEHKQQSKRDKGVSFGDRV